MVKFQVFSLIAVIVLSLDTYGSSTIFSKKRLSSQQYEALESYFESEDVLTGDNTKLYPSLNLKDSDGNVPLIKALKDKDWDLIKKLLNSNADWTIKNNLKQSFFSENLWGTEIEKRAKFGAKVLRKYLVEHILTWISDNYSTNFLDKPIIAKTKRMHLHAYLPTAVDVSRDGGNLRVEWYDLLFSQSSIFQGELIGLNLMGLNVLLSESDITTISKRINNRSNLTTGEFLKWFEKHLKGPKFVPDDESDDEDRFPLCCVCEAKVRNIIYKKCQHLKLCSDCVDPIKHCPSCRSREIGEYIQIDVEADYLAQNRVCNGCYERPCNVILGGCHHMGYCDQCYSVFKKCPESGCQQLIESTDFIYFKTQ